MNKLLRGELGDIDPTVIRTVRHALDKDLKVSDYSICKIHINRFINRFSLF